MSWSYSFSQSILPLEVAIEDSHVLVWLLELELSISTLYCDLFWVLSCLSVAPCVVLQDRSAFVWPVSFGFIFSRLQCGLLWWEKGYHALVLAFWGSGKLYFGVLA